MQVAGETPATDNRWYKFTILGASFIIIVCRYIKRYPVFTSPLTPLQRRWELGPSGRKPLNLTAFYYSITDTNILRIEA